MKELNKNQMKAYNNLREVFNDYKAGNASISELEIAKAKYDRSMNYKPMPTVTKAGTVLAALGLVGALGSCADRSIVNDEIVDSEETKVESVATDMNSQIKEHEEAFEEKLVGATEEVLTKNVLSEDFFGTTLKEDPELYVDNLTRLVEMNARYIVVNSVIEDNPVFTPTELAVLDKDGSLPTVTEFTNDAQLGETNMEMLLTVAAYQDPAVDYSNFFSKKADINYINNITNMINKLSRGMQSGDETLVEEARQELLVEKDKLVTNDPSLASISYVAIKEAFQKIEIANMSVEVLTQEEQEIINHMIQEKCGEFKDGMTELDVKGSYIYHVMEEYLAKSAKIDASMYDGLTWNELIEKVVDKVLEDILNKKITLSFFNEKTSSFAIINNYINAKIKEVVYEYTIVTGGGCVTTKVGETTKTETKVVTKDKVPTKDLIPEETTYKDHNTGKPLTEEEVNKRLKEIEEANAAIETIGNGGSVSEEIINKDEDVKNAVDVTEAAKNYRKVEDIPFEGGKEEKVGSIEDVPLSTNAVEPTAEVAKPTRAISSTAIDEQGNRINESYHEFYDTEEVNYEVVNSDDAIYFDDGEVVMSIVTEGGMTK